jgi:ferric-dicitrate binding protein FerR (iron transport regulator)
MTLKQTKDLGEVPAAALVRLVHTQRGHMSTRQRVEGVQSLIARAKWNRSDVRLPLRSVVASVLMITVLVSAIAMFALERHAARALSYAIDGGHVERGGSIQPDSSSQPRLRFSDGSEVVLETAAKASLGSVDSQGARLSVAEGSAHIDVAHKPRARWLFDAGPFLITVTGTAFTLRWKPAEEQLDVRMERGTVEVTGPLSDGAILLRAGQHLIIRVRQRETRIVDLEDHAVAGSEPPANDGAPVADQDRPGSVAPRNAAESRLAQSAAMRANQGTANRDWGGQLASGDSEGIVRQAEHMGLEACLAQSDSADLASLADAARYGRHDDIARKALLAQRHRFPLSTAARDASFLLGRLDETEQNLPAAIEWYDRYLAENPAGTYASEALGRKMTLAQRLYGDEKARAMAREYLSRFPRGMYAARAHALSQAP